MKLSAPNCERGTSVKQKLQNNTQIINNTKQDELLKRDAKDKLILSDLTREQWFWDMSVPS
ncbi:MAG: hypothetical protein K0R78_604 [Pelosinus sp.]|jgi:hypothetical protein|nr:hypothetical protein [Pelosinus sp.]